MNIGKNMITGYLKLFAKHILKVPWTNITINVIIKKKLSFRIINIHYKRHFTCCMVLSQHTHLLNFLQHGAPPSNDDVRWLF